MSKFKVGDIVERIDHKDWKGSKWKVVKIGLVTKDYPVSRFILLNNYNWHMAGYEDCWYEKRFSILKPVIRKAPAWL